MKRLAYCVLASLLIGGSALCSGQAIGEMVQIQPKVSPPAPAMSGSSNGFSGRSRVRRNIPSTSGGIITISKGHYQLPAKKSSTGQAQPAFTIHGDDSEQASTNAQPAQSPKPQAAPTKVENPATPKNGAPAAVPPS